MYIYFYLYSFGYLYSLPGTKVYFFSVFLTLHRYLKSSLCRIFTAESLKIPLLRSYIEFLQYLLLFERYTLIVISKNLQCTNLFFVEIIRLKLITVVEFVVFQIVVCFFASVNSKTVPPAYLRMLCK